MVEKVAVAVGWKERDGEGDGFGLGERCRGEGKGQGLVKMATGNSSLLPWLLTFGFGLANQGF